MREAVIDRLFIEFGVPGAESPTAFCWHLGPGLDMVAEKDSLPVQGVVWIPWQDWSSHPVFGEFYDGASDRHAGTFSAACPTLGRGRAALRMAIMQQAELDEAVELIQMLARGQQAAQ